ncbi:MAG TPA: hypothetical protein RMH99_09270 [Sandaracinaceae bacterium LLY-WYZ-13_1]|nr:hypothetical protein [Sandaracinaceae bacterium LLY-WYZ-13_1]
MGGRALVWTDRRVEVAGVRRVTRALRSPELQIQLLEVQGLTFDSRPFQDVFPDLGTRRHTLTAVLDGAYESAPSAVGEAGTLVHERRIRWLERWSGRRQRFVTIVWGDGEATTGAATERLGPRAREAWTEIADAIAAGGDPDAILRRVRTAARAAGLSIPTPQAPVPAEVARLEAALSHACTHLHENPQWVDLEEWTGRSARQLRRTFREHAPWLGSSGLRARLHRYRLQLAHGLLETDLSSTRVARALGYGSDRAMYTALRRAGLGRGAAA